MTRRVWLCAAAMLAGCSDPPASPGSAAVRSEVGGPWFDEVAREAGLRFEHFNGMTGAFHMAENVAPGVALCDFDGDGDLDVFFPQGAMFDPNRSPEEALLPWTGTEPPIDRLFRNDLDEPGGTLRFTDVTESSDLVDGGYAMGAACADFDGDGRVDLFVTHLGEDRLFRNTGGLRFEPVPLPDGAAASAWSVSAAAIDLDADGLPELFVGRYLHWSVTLDKNCAAATGLEDYCAPDSYRPLPDRLYENLGGFRFREATRMRGLARAAGAALGVLDLDADLDGRTDVYVANDGSANYLWIREDDGRFRDDALFAGCALNRDGLAEASMGVDAADVDRDGDEDLVMVHLHGETNTYYENLGDGRFEDRSNASGLGTPSTAFTGFGAGLRDFDLDGRLDLFVANGAVRTIESQREAGDPYPLAERDQLFAGRSGGFFEERTPAEEPVLETLAVSRGAAFGDLDNDGDVDVVVAGSAGPARLLKNIAPRERTWIGIRALWGSPSRDALGAWVEAELVDGPAGARIRTGGSYASANDPRRVFAVPVDGSIAVVVRWPDGASERFSALETGTYHDLIRGAGESAP